MLIEYLLCANHNCSIWREIPKSPNPPNWGFGEESPCPQRAYVRMGGGFGVRGDEMVGSRAKNWSPLQGQE